MGDVMLDDMENVAGSAMEIVKHHDGLFLIAPSLEYERQIQAFRQEFVINGGSMDGCSSLRRMENIADWIQQVEDFSSAETCPEGFVTASQFICVRERDRKVVGVIQIRHYFNEHLEKYGGHIGYSVCHSERRKGYATRMLHDILPICRGLGLTRILVTCLTDNEGSRRTILHNGGVYESTVYEPNEDVHLERYWIELS